MQGCGRFRAMTAQDRHAHGQIQNLQWVFQNVYGVQAGGEAVQYENT
jgi:hypothetical protein